MVDASIEALLAFAGNGFADATHTARFSRTAGFSGPQETHAGNVFGHAIVAEALASVLDRAPHVEPVVERELTHLLSLRRNDRSGWAYYPHLRELPADADCLAATLRALVRAHGRSYAAAQTHEPLFRWLAGVPSDGNVSTWIPSSDPELARLQTTWIESMWGDSYDVAVCAHMVLALVDLGGTGAAIDAVRAAIARAQQPDGTWTSSLHRTPWYATMIACLALHTDPGYAEALQRAFTALAASRAPDGGWAARGRTSDALTTSFALLALDAIAARAPSLPVQGLALAALRCLAALRRERTATLVPFLRNEATSASITVAYSLKAALVWEPVVSLE